MVPTRAVEKKSMSFWDNVTYGVLSRKLINAGEKEEGEEAHSDQDGYIWPLSCTLRKALMIARWSSLTDLRLRITSPLLT